MSYIKNIPHEEVLVLAEQVSVLEGQVVSKTLAQNRHVSLTLFAFAKGEDGERAKPRRRRRGGQRAKREGGPKPAAGKADAPDKQAPAKEKGKGKNRAKSEEMQP